MRNRCWRRSSCPSVRRLARSAPTPSVAHIGEVRRVRWKEAGATIDGVAQSSKLVRLTALVLCSPVFLPLPLSISRFKAAARRTRQLVDIGVCCAGSPRRPFLYAREMYQVGYTGQKAEQEAEGAIRRSRHASTHSARGICYIRKALPDLSRAPSPIMRIIHSHDLSVLCIAKNSCI
jgi:hypothetical protein